MSIQTIKAVIGFTKENTAFLINFNKYKYINSYTVFHKIDLNKIKNNNNNFKT